MGLSATEEIKTLYLSGPKFQSWPTDHLLPHSIQFATHLSSDHLTPYTPHLFKGISNNPRTKETDNPNQCVGRSNQHHKKIIHNKLKDNSACVLIFTWKTLVNSGTFKIFSPCITETSV